MPPSAALPGHTPAHVDCPICDAAKLKHIRSADFSRMRFCDAAPLWFAEHALEIAAKTRGDYEYYLRSLLKFFGEMPLRAIHSGHVEAYQKWRQTPHKDERGREWKAGPSAINHEISTLAQILERAGLWADVDKHYKPLHQAQSQIGRVLSEEQKQRLFVVACSNPRWFVAYQASLLSVNTTTGPGEIRHLRLREIELAEKNPRILIAEGLKNENRYRSVPLNEPAVDAVKALVRRARRIIAQEGLELDPDFYLLPALRGKGQKGYDPMRAQGSWKHSWDSLRKKADLPCLRLYDLRHQIITEMLEDPDISEQTIQEIAGHKISSRVLKHYSHIRDQRKREALKKVETKAPPKQLPFCFPEGSSEFDTSQTQPAEKIASGGARVISFVPKKSLG